MAELVDVVLDAPVHARLVALPGPHLGGDDLVGDAVAGDERRAVVVHDHAFAHRVERAVGAGEADRGRVHQVAEGVGLVGEVPALADRRGVARRADHDVGALVGALARHLGEHAVVADDQRDLRAVRPVAHRDAEVARLPRLDRHPGMHLAVIELDLALVVDDQARVERVAVGIELHDGEAAPDVIGDAGAAEALDLGAVEPAHDRRIGVHRQAVQRIFREDDQVHGRHVAPRLADQFADAVGLPREIRVGDDDRDSGSAPAR